MHTDDSVYWERKEYEYPSDPSTAWLREILHFESIVPQPNVGERHMSLGQTAGGAVLVFNRGDLCQAEGRLGDRPILRPLRVFFGLVFLCH